MLPLAIRDTTSRKQSTKTSSSRVDGIALTRRSRNEPGSSLQVRPLPHVFTMVALADPSRRRSLGRQILPQVMDLNVTINFRMLRLRFC